MSNAVDILMVDGPVAGLVVCQPRPVPSTLEVPAANGMLQYNHKTHKGYHIGTFGEVSEADADLAIMYSGLTPSWDLK